MNTITNKQEFMTEFMESLMESLGGEQSHELFSSEDAVRIAAEVLDDMIKED